MKRLHRHGLPLLLVAALGWTANATAEEWKPNGPIKLVAPVAPGTAADATARYFAKEIGQAMNTPVVVDNRVGANGILGSDAVAKSAPDGRTLLVVSSPHYINKSVYAQLPFDPIRDFTPVAGISDGCLVLVVAEDSPFKTLNDLLAHAKGHPGDLDYSSSGTGSVPHLAASVMLSQAQATATHVPYKGGDQAVADVVSKQVTFMFAPLTSAVPLVQAKRLRALAVSARARVPSLPDTPTVGEAGLQGYEVVTRFGFLAAAGTDPRAIDRLSKVITTIAASEGFREFALPKGFVPHVADSAQYASTRQAELDKWAEVVRISGARAE